MYCIPGWYNYWSFTCSCNMGRTHTRYNHILGRYLRHLIMYKFVIDNTLYSISYRVLKKRGCRLGTKLFYWHRHTICCHSLKCVLSMFMQLIGPTNRANEWGRRPRWGWHLTYGEHLSRTIWGRRLKNLSHNCRGRVRPQADPRFTREACRGVP